MTSQTKFKVIFFDLGNTLSYFHGDWDHTINLAIGKLNIYLTENGILEPHSNFTQTFSDSLKNYYITRDIDCVETTTAVLLKNLLMDNFQITIESTKLYTGLDIFYKTTGEHWQVDEFAIDTLENLKLNGYRLGLISNASHAPDVNQQINEQGLASFFDNIVISADVGVRKPHPTIFFRALDYFSCTPDQAVMVGDTLNADILGSRKIGMKNVWVRRWTSPTTTHVYDDAIIPDRTIQYLFELPSLLDYWFH